MSKYYLKNTKKALKNPRLNLEFEGHSSINSLD